MPRYRLLLEYDGRPFSGWQTQADAPSVQAALERAASALNGAPVAVIGAGRTDSGVHATGQAAHLDMQKHFAADTIADALNAHLRPAPIAILKAWEVSDAFHARFSARSRRYRYVIVNRRADLALERGLAWRVPGSLDAVAMHSAAQILVGEHDFTTFRDAQCQAASPVKTVDAIDIAREDDRISARFSARSFLHRQVRSFMGSLVEIGRGRRDAAWLGEILAAADRAACGPVAPPSGLYLDRVDYDT
ncbi:MAG: tRNA pseudouridine(38-40) synthase TruA [Pseudomonadota bacterium]